MLTELFEHRVERLDLRSVARVAIEDPAVGGVVLRKAVLDDGVRQLVGHEFALVGVRERLKAERGLVLDVEAEDVAGRDGRNVVVRAQQSSLRTLAHTLGAHDQQSHESSFHTWSIPARMPGASQG